MTIKHWYKPGIVVVMASLFCACLVWIYFLLQPLSYRSDIVLIRETATDFSNHYPDFDALLLSQNVLDATAVELKKDTGFNLGRQDIREKLRFRTDGSHLVVTARDENPQLVQSLARSYADAYRRAAQNFFDQYNQIDNENLSTLDHDITEARRRLQQIMEMHFDKPSSRKNIDDMRRASLMQKLIDALIDNYQKNALAYEIDMTLHQERSLLNLSFIAQAPSMVVLLQRQYSLETQIAHMQSQLGDQSPQIRAMRKEYDSRARQIEKEALRLAWQFKNDAEISASVVRKIEEELNNTVLPVIDSNSFEDIDDAQKAMFAALDAKISYLRKYEKPSLATLMPRLIGDATSPQEDSPLYYRWIAGTFILFILVFSGLVVFFYYDSSRSSLADPGKGNLHSTVIKKKISREKLINETADSIKGAYCFFGNGAEELAAQLALCKTKKFDVLMVDLGGQEISRYITSHVGLSDVLENLSSLHDAIYHDKETGVDILTKGKAALSGEYDTVKAADHIVSDIRAHYQIVVMSLSEATALPLHSFLDNAHLYVVSHGDQDEEALLWASTLEAMEYRRFTFVMV